ncbi:hypothetical protein SPLC1_S541820 [Arthrospira platensis C1]|uniref:Uncharacterized protein n=1 Tax=Limnospira maxima CS-328 TaxID=513049 RepID=B5W3E7_LIMMA|nr:hypothetical protein AmaxDRAFT_3325 [Limnospira maxima CS-328]EKD06237.1 hypothetical protein SPLC1_S541820 [Arthrospira platensis C1]UWU48940.1 hypothetical protein APLC1_3746 [Arthrospira platensis C1]
MGILPGFVFANFMLSDVKTEKIESRVITLLSVSDMSFFPL